MPSISVAMATYNGEPYIQEQLESLSQQTRLPIELCVGDDGSTDGTKAAVREFALKAPFPVHLHTNSKRLGYAENFIQTAQRCTGDWIAFCDQDDVWLPQKLDVCAAAIQSDQSPDLMLIAHAAKIVDEQLSWAGRRLPDDPSRSRTGPLGRNLFFSHLGCAFVFSASLIRDFDQSRRLPTLFTNVARYPHDSWITQLANVMGRIVELDDDLILYRRHDATTSIAGKTKKQGLFRAAMAIGDDHYRWVSQVCQESHSCLNDQAEKQINELFADRLRDGAAAFHTLGQAYHARADLYREPHPLKKIPPLVRLMRRGYRGLGASSFGWRSFGKDLTEVVLGACRRLKPIRW